MKFTLAIYIALLLPCMVMHGESEIRMNGIENRINNLETNSGNPLFHPITPCAGPKVRNGMDIYLSASFLYWTARLDTLTYAKTGFGDLANSISSDKGQVKSVDWSWDPGFKVGMGWNFAHGCWDMNLHYTWFYTNVGNSTQSEFLQPGFEIFTPASQSIDIPAFGQASAHYDLHYQLGDLELGRNFYVSKSLKLRPFFGVKGTWQKQDYNVFYNTLSLQVVLQQLLFSYSARFDHSLWGVGAHGGLHTSWQFSKGFSLYGNMSVSGMWLHYNTERKDEFTRVDEDQSAQLTISTVNAQDRPSIIKPLIEMSVGLRAETYFSSGRYHILLEAGWESQIWVNQTLFISLSDHYDRFDLSLQGLRAKMRFDF